MKEPDFDQTVRKRVPKYLEPLTSPPKDRPYAVFDIESKEADSQKKGFTRPFMVGFHDGKIYRSFRNQPQVARLPWYERAVARGGNIDLFMRHLLGNHNEKGESPFAGHDVYAHNMGSFDGLFLPAWLERNNQWVSYKIMPIQSRIQCVEVWRHNKGRYRMGLAAQRTADKKDREQYGVIRILDSFRIMPSALDKIAKAFGLEGKLKDFDLDTQEDDPLWEKYNEVDCVQLYQTIDKYKDMISQLGGEVGITAPSTAVKLLRRKYMEDGSKLHRNIHFDDCSLEDECQGCAHDFFRAAYFGGRTEIFRMMGVGFYYDVNSSYPFSMTKYMPVGEMTELGENQDFTRYASNEQYIGFVRCTVDIPEDTYLPPLPVQHGGKLKFPAGRFSGTWDWIELRQLKRVGGRILHVEKSVWIKGERFLVPFVNSLYAMRKKGSTQYKGPALSEVAKIMLNSTFGKFGMDQDRLEMMILKPGEEEPWEARYPGESDDHRDKRKRAEKDGSHEYHVSTPLPDEPAEDFEKRREAERKGLFGTASRERWQLPDMTASSGIYEHDSLIRVRDIRIDAAYIIPQIAAHITASSRILLWTYLMDITDQCQTCQACGLPYVEHVICTQCQQPSVVHFDFPVEADQKVACDHFTPPCAGYTRCGYSRQDHEAGYTNCSFEPHHVYYSDTDSALSSYADFPESVELGGLKKEFAEPILIESYAPKMYRLSKPTPFEGTHERNDGGKRCAQLCPGCLKATDEDRKDASKKIINGCLLGVHQVDEEGKRKCEKTCPGCSARKIMMKGVPKDMRTFETVEKLLIKRESVSYQQHEKLGAIAKRGFRETPRMHEVKKSMKSEYDKRVLNGKTGNTQPIVLSGTNYQSERYRSLEETYRTPSWLERVLIKND